MIIFCFLRGYSHLTVSIRPSTGFVTMSRGNRKVKVYNWLTGKVEFLLGGGEDFKFDYLVVSKLMLVK